MKTSRSGTLTLDADTSIEDDELLDEFHDNKHDSANQFGKSNDEIFPTFEKLAEIEVKQVDNKEESEESSSSEDESTSTVDHENVQVEAVVEDGEEIDENQSETEMQASSSSEEDEVTDNVVVENEAIDAADNVPVQEEALGERIEVHEEIEEEVTEDAEIEASPVIVELESVDNSPVLVDAKDDLQTSPVIVELESEVKSTVEAEIFLDAENNELDGTQNVNLISTPTIIEPDVDNSIKPESDTDNSSELLSPAQSFQIPNRRESTTTDVLDQEPKKSMTKRVSVAIGKGLFGMFGSVLDTLGFSADTPEPQTTQEEKKVVEEDEISLDDIKADIFFHEDEGNWSHSSPAVSESEFSSVAGESKSEPIVMIEPKIVEETDLEIPVTEVAGENPEESPIVDVVLVSPVVEDSEMNVPAVNISNKAEAVQSLIDSKSVSTEKITDNLADNRPLSQLIKKDEISKSQELTEKQRDAIQAKAAPVFVPQKPQPEAVVEQKFVEPEKPKDAKKEVAAKSKGKKGKGAKGKVAAAATTEVKQVSAPIETKVIPTEVMKASAPAEVEAKQAPLLAEVEVKQAPLEVPAKQSPAPIEVKETILAKEPAPVPAAQTANTDLALQATLEKKAPSISAIAERPKTPLVSLENLALKPRVASVSNLGPPPVVPKELSPAAKLAKMTQEPTKELPQVAKITEKKTERPASPKSDLTSHRKENSKSKSKGKGGEKQAPIIPPKSTIPKETPKPVVPPKGPTQKDSAKVTSTPNVSKEVSKSTSNNSIPKEEAKPISAPNVAKEAKISAVPPPTPKPVDAPTRKNTTSKSKSKTKATSPNEKTTKSSEVTKEKEVPAPVEVAKSKTVDAAKPKSPEVPKEQPKPAEVPKEPASKSKAKSKSKTNSATPSEKEKVASTETKAPAAQKTAETKGAKPVDSKLPPASEVKPAEVPKEKSKSKSKTKSKASPAAPVEAPKAKEVVIKTSAPSQPEATEKSKKKSKSKASKTPISKKEEEPIASIKPVSVENVEQVQVATEDVLPEPPAAPQILDSEPATPPKTELERVASKDVISATEIVENENQKEVDVSQTEAVPEIAPTARPQKVVYQPPEVDFSEIFQDWLGQKRGLFVFRIENFIPIMQPEAGVFCVADSYIILLTTKEDGQYANQVYTWIGSESATDKMFCCAMYAVALRNQANASNKILRQVIL